MKQLHIITPRVSVCDNRAAIWEDLCIYVFSINSVTITATA